MGLTRRERAVLLDQLTRSPSTAVRAGAMLRLGVGLRSRPFAAPFQRSSWAGWRRFDQFRPPLRFPIGKGLRYGPDLKGRAGVFRIDARSGDVSPIFYQTRIENISYEGFAWSPDGKRMYYHGQRGSIFEVDLASGAERVIADAPSMDSKPIDGRLGVISVSPDGQWIATSRSEAAGKAAVVTLLPVIGGTPRDLLRINAPDWVNNAAMPWTPDGRAILVRKMTDPDGTTSELWRVPIDGGAPTKRDFDANHVAAYAQGRISLHPDGGRVAYVTRTKSSIEVWALENFLPARERR